MSLFSLLPVSVPASATDESGSTCTPISPPSRPQVAARRSEMRAPDELFNLKCRTHALQAERDHYEQLGQRAADAFEEHRRDLTQLVQKERAIRSHREDALRRKLQDALEENRELMARVIEQRRQHDDAWRAELNELRDANAQRQTELEELLTQLHTERSELQRSVVDAERTQHTYRREIDMCLEEQKQLLKKVRLLRDGLVGTADERGIKADKYWPAGEHHAMGHESFPTRCHPHSRQLCCECCDVPPGVWTGPSPTRRVPRRRFVPAGPWDACSPSRASSPATHHVDALISNIERENYLRPRFYLQRCGQGVAPLLSTTTEPSFWASENIGVDKRGASPCCSAASQSRPRQHQRSGSQGLSSTTASSTSRTSETNTSCATSSSSGSTYTVPIHKCAEEKRLHRSTCRMQSRQRASSSRCLRRSSPRLCCTELQGDSNHYQHHGPLHNEAAHPFPLLAATPSAAGHKGYCGSAINAVCHSLISDLAATRAEYQRYQRQLRDPHCDSVEASQQMRRLMRQIDAKIDQIRTLRKQQEKYCNDLRMHDVLQHVMAENRYCEAVYKDLMELIRG